MDKQSEIKQRFEAFQKSTMAEESAMRTRFSQRKAALKARIEQMGDKRRAIEAELAQTAFVGSETELEKVRQDLANCHAELKILEDELSLLEGSNSQLEQALKDSRKKRTNSGEPAQLQLEAYAEAQQLSNRVSELLQGLLEKRDEYLADIQELGQAARGCQTMARVCFGLDDFTTGGPMEDELARLDKLKTLFFDSGQYLIDLDNFVAAIGPLAPWGFLPSNQHRIPAGGRVNGSN